MTTSDAPGAGPPVDLATPELLLDRHPGLSTGIATCMVEAAGVALARRHHPPTLVRVNDDARSVELSVAWREPDARVARAWRDPGRATEWAAEALAIVAIDALRGLVVVDRALRGSQVDFYLGRAGDNLEHAAALEVAGVDEGPIKGTVRAKAVQARRNQDRLPALAAAVRFREPYVIVLDVHRSRHED